MTEPTCGRCHRTPHDHPSGNCPDGGGTYTFVIADEAAQWIRDNPDVPEVQLVTRYVAHVRRQHAAVDRSLADVSDLSEVQKAEIVRRMQAGADGLRMHSAAAAGAGDLGSIPAGEVLGACPACGAELRTCDAVNPHSGRTERALQHPVPFCSYFGETDPAEIERKIVGKPS